MDTSIWEGALFTYFTTASVTGSPFDQIGNYQWGFLILFTLTALGISYLSISIKPIGIFAIDMPRRYNFSQLTAPTQMRLLKVPSKNNIGELLAPATEPRRFISKDTEARLLKELIEIERGDALLKKDVSISTLAYMLRTNQRYISHIVKKYRNTDFKNYLQQYRIKYIVGKMRTNAEFLDYKLSYIAAISGFSTHSKFSAAFKEVMGMSPSQFVLKERQKSIKKINGQTSECEPEE